MKKIAVINEKPLDGLTRTVLDGLLILAERGEVDFRVSSEFRSELPLEHRILPKAEFIQFAKDSDAIFLMYNKYGVNVRLAEEIGMWEKTAFFDGSELGGNNRFDVETQKRVLAGTYKGQGAINHDMLARCLLYFRREKPYSKGMIPLSFGIERKYTETAAARPPKDIDFFCVFGQDEYPILRRYVREELERFCKKNGFTCVTEKMSKEDFYKTLGRAKVGISVGGGGFDTYRFWEILGANAVLMTETIDVYPKYSAVLGFERIWQFNNLFDFTYELERVGEFLREEYPKVFVTPAWQGEYDRIIATHGSVARAKTAIDTIFKKRPGYHQ
jgi:hypothetical protein